MRAAELLWEDERKRFTEAANKYAMDIEEYKVKLQKAKMEVKSDADHQPIPTMKKTEYENEIKQLSQQLLKKQESVQELLAERSALKVRVHDLVTRYILGLVHINLFNILFLE